MKKIIASAVGLMVAGGLAATTAQAVESQFGGYWRTRFTYSDNMQGTAATKDDSADNDSGSWYRTDTRTRLYYTAKFNDDFQFVNKFEFNTKWGESNGGSIGADGTSKWRIKNSYAQFQLGMLNSRVGIQGATIARGFLFADDFSGIIEQIDLSGGNQSGMRIPFGYMAVSNDGSNITEDGDSNMYFIAPVIPVNDQITLNPHFTLLAESGTNTTTYWTGIDADLNFDAFSAWVTTAYNGGEKQDNDISGYLLAAGAEAGIVHGQAFYASGDKSAKDNNNSNPLVDDDADTDQFQSMPGQSYYWSEIMGLGVFDQQASNGAPGDKISNVWAANVGVTLMPMDKMTLTLDAWYAMLAVENESGDDDLGLEFDANLSYELMDNLNAQLIAAYLIAGDATGDDDVFEGGLQLSLKF